MEAQLSSRINMLDSVRGIFTNYSVPIAAKPVFAAMVDTFDDSMVVIENLRLIVGRDDTGITVDKADSRMILHLKGDRLRRALYSFAMVSDNDSIGHVVDDPKSEVSKLKDNEFIDQMKRYHALAVTHAVALVDYEVTAGDITDFSTAINDFIGWKPDPRNATIQREHARNELLRAVAELIQFLVKRVDPAMYLFESSNPDFYGEYFLAREIVDPAGPNSQTENGINPIETDTIINLPFTNLGAGKEVRVKCLTPGTNFEIYCSNAPSVPPTGTPLSINDVISPIHTTTDDLGSLSDSPYVNIHFPPLPVQIEWEVRVG